MLMVKIDYHHGDDDKVNDSKLHIAAFLQTKT